MKASELMIGDWIRYGSRFGIVKAIKTGECLILVSCNGNDELIWETLDNIESIPLTPETLENNGFNIEIAPYTPDWKRCILNPNFFLEDRLKGFYHFNGNNLAKIQYVHELQHALRLCGIDKTIEL